jgi:hypothetical protein
MNDTPAAISKIIVERHRAMTPAERWSAASTLFEAARKIVESSLPSGLEKRFHDECRRLRAPDVTLNFPGRQGQVTRRKMVGAYKPEQVLSEGEQKALALADFLAEVTAVPASSPVVFDDPITSMDYRRGKPADTSRPIPNPSRRRASARRRTSSKPTMRPC